MDRRLCLAWMAAATASPGAFGQAPAPWAQTPIRIVTPSPVGVGSDAFARLYAEHLGKQLKASVIVENRPGASSTLGTDVVAKAPANGLTLLFSTSTPLTVAPHLLARVPYKVGELQPVAALYRGGSFLVVGSAFKGQSLKDLVAQARARPGSVDYASYGPGSTAHLGVELFSDAAGIELNHIPYKQSAMPDLIGGQVTLGWEPPVSALPNIRSGKVRALAYSGDRRSAALPEVPALAETYPGLAVFTWVGVWVPAGTPEPLVKQLQTALQAVTHAPEVLKALAEAGVEPMTAGPAEMSTLVERESATMGRLIKAKNITLN